MANQKMLRRKAASKSPKDLPDSQVWFGKVSERPITSRWPAFETCIISPICCPDCGHVLKEPYAGAIMKLDDFSVMPNIADPLYKKREAAAKKAAWKRFLEGSAGKAWLRLEKKPNKANYDRLAAVMRMREPS